MSTEGIALVSYVLFLLSSVAGLGFGIAGFFYIFEANKNMRENRKWRAALPFAVFMPSLFTDLGNKNRVNALRCIGCFLVCVAIAGAAGVWNHYLSASESGTQSSAQASIT
ncbi:hypothetical protein P3339_17410 [Microbulbifer sp. MLAF003]|uniref:hypothetical protein n=1 Tax=Microbulbifer sp. MLAF003 TaxID=3032582 RepID=UPI0024ACC8BB|nr:hypothetical protein [Microbulbifer sp. MLAF003]WHI50209.1 hypothetical protein P3339_17410 [Microbulbifer sp. MLAF003]